MVQALPGVLAARGCLGQDRRVVAPWWAHRSCSAGLALPSSRSQSAAVTPSSTTSSTRATPAPSAPAAASTTSPSPAPSSGNGTSTAASPTQPIQLSDLQSILATMNVPAGPGGGQQGNTCSSAPGWGVKVPAAPCPPAGFPRHGPKHVPGPSCCPARVTSSSPHHARQFCSLESVTVLLSGHLGWPPAADGRLLVP